MLRHQLDGHCERIYIKYVEKWVGNFKKSSFLHHIHPDCTTPVCAGSIYETLFLDTFAKQLLTGNY